MPASLPATSFFVGLAPAKLCSIVPPADTAAGPPPPAADLYLIDTMGYIFRAYHAMPRLSNSRGVPTQAVLGFTNMLRKLLVQADPPALAAAFDLAGPTFREAEFAAYKAQRPAMPEDLGPQLPLIRRVLEAYNIPILESPAYEADDIIGTLARQAAAAGRRVVIVSSDKDMLQLVNERICVLIPTRGDLLCGPAEVEQMLGVRPEQVPDLLALRGDSVDNIPGAPGIGEKGARDLIQRFGAVENALAHAAEVERKTYRESLANNADQVRLSLRLATIHTDAPVALDWEQLRRRDPDLEACRALFTELEFSALLRSLDAAEPAPAPAAAPAETAATPASAAEVAAFLASRPSGPWALAVQDDGGLEIGDGVRAWRLAPDSDCEPLDAAWRQSAAGAEWRVFDLKATQRALGKLRLPRLPESQVQDAQLYAYLLDPTQPAASLAAVAQRRWGQPLSEAPASALFRLAGELRPEAEAAGLGRCYLELDRPLAAVLEDMEDAGIALDPAAVAELAAELEKECVRLEAAIFGLAGGRQFNINSPKQLGEVLFEHLQLPAPNRRGKTKSLSTAQDVLEELAGSFEITARVLEYRQVSKLKSTYADALPKLLDPVDGRLHTTFSQVGSATGRLSSSNPNLQNIPVRTEAGRRIRAAFFPAPGFLLVAADYSQIELRLLAHFSGDPLLAEAFRQGTDVHAQTAAQVFGLAPEAVGPEHRRRAKAVNFGIIYGLSAFGLARQLGIPQAEAAGFIARYFERYAYVRAFIDDTLANARREGEVRTWFGRRRPIPDLQSRNPNLRGFAERTAVNTRLQGTAADLMRLAMIRVWRRLQGTPARLLLQVHDELVIEAPAQRAAEFGALLREEMEGVAALSVPLTAEAGAGPNWRDIEPLG